MNISIIPPKISEFRLRLARPVCSRDVLKNSACLQLKPPTILKDFICSFDEMHRGIILRLLEDIKVIETYF